MKSLIIKCPKCGKEFNCITKHGNRNKFCSRSCANIRVWDEEKRARHSILAKNHPTYKPQNLVKRTCPCGKEFLVRPCLKRKHCCHACSVTYRPKEIRNKCGGYREGSGRSKSGYYKGIYCGSTYELCWVIYHLDNYLPFKRFKGFLKGHGIKYYPDFLIDNKIIEIKGYWTDSVDKKTKLAESMGYEIEVLYKENLKKVFDYVKEKYGTHKFQTLYDDHKPSYVGICCECKKEFSKERTQPRTKNVFCSRSCCGKYRKKIPRVGNAPTSHP